MVRILVVDDDPAQRAILRRWLERRGYQVTEAEHGAEALHIARHIPPDLVISDVLMPEMDGFTLCRQWRQDERLASIPFVFYSATYTDPEDQRLALNLGAARFIPRPAGREDFLQQIEEALTAVVRGAVTQARVPPMDEETFLRAYNAALVRKLEEKVQQLEELNRTLEQRVAERTAELQRLVDAMAGRELRMAQLKTMIRRLQAQLRAHGLEPDIDDSLWQPEPPPDA